MREKCEKVYEYLDINSHLATEWHPVLRSLAPSLSPIFAHCLVLRNIRTHIYERFYILNGHRTNHLVPFFECSKILVHTRIIISASDTLCAMFCLFLLKVISFMMPNSSQQHIFKWNTWKEISFQSISFGVFHFMSAWYLVETCVFALIVRVCIFHCRCLCLSVSLCVDCNECK